MFNSVVGEVVELGRKRWILELEDNDLNFGFIVYWLSNFGKIFKCFKF